MKTFLIVIVLFMGAALFLTKSPKSEPAIVAKFHIGELVQSRLTGAKGFVISRWCGGDPARGSVCRYDVRFASPALQTDTRVVGNDEPAMMSPLIIINMIHEFELEKVIP